MLRSISEVPYLVFYLPIHKEKGLVLHNGKILVLQVNLYGLQYILGTCIKLINSKVSMKVPKFRRTIHQSELYSSQNS